MYPRGWGQLRVDLEIEGGGLTQGLPYQFCMVDLIRKDLLGEDMFFTKIPGIYQFNAIPGNENNTDPTALWMEKTYNYLEI